jgi:hypothetical protein
MTEPQTVELWRCGYTARCSTRECPRRATLRSPASRDAQVWIILLECPSLPVTGLRSATETLRRKMLGAGVPPARHYDPALSRQPGAARSSDRRLRHPRERAEC